MTKEERHLWFDFLRDYPIKFRRQEIIGHYIADFYCSKAKLIVELDGSQHCEEKEICYDEARTRYFQSLGLRVLRFSNLDVMRNFEGVCTAIMEASDPSVTAQFHASPERGGAACNITDLKPNEMGSNRRGRRN